jgi:hypothetical protein
MTGRHFIQAYTEDAFLAGVVAEYLGAGLRQGEAAIVIATAKHVASFSDRLAALGVDVTSAQRARQLLFLDAERALGRFMVDGRPDRELFRALVATALDHVRAGGQRRVRLYGEMVDLLWAESLEATVELEELWNEVLDDEHLSLLCAYRLDPLDRGVQRVFRRVTHCHSELLPEERAEAFDAAVERAYDDVFGADSDWPTLRELLVAHQSLVTRMPAAHAAIFALDALLPAIGDRVRLKARQHYRLPG